MKAVGLYTITLMFLAISLFITGNNACAAQVKNLVVNSFFEEGAAGWTLECHDPYVRADIMADSSTKVVGENSLKVDIREIQAGAENWRCQPKQTGLELRGGQRYTWSFWAKAVRERQLQCQVLVDVWDWRLLGLDQPVTITTEWKEYFHTFACPEDYYNVRITWLCAQSLDDFWLDNIILYEGDYIEGLMADKLLKKPQAVDPHSVLASSWGRVKSGR